MTQGDGFVNYQSFHVDLFRTKRRWLITRYIFGFEIFHENKKLQYDSINPKEKRGNKKVCSNKGNWIY